MTKKVMELNYSAKTVELDMVLAALQNPDIQVDEATKLYTTGQTLISELETYLKQAETIVRAHTA